MTCYTAVYHKKKNISNSRPNNNNNSHSNNHTGTVSKRAWTVVTAFIT